MSKDKKQETKELTVQEAPPSPPKEEESKAAKDETKPRGSYALADMEKATFDAVSENL